MGASQAVDFLIKDHGDVGSGFREDFARDRPYKSILQRNNVSLEDLLKMFDWHEDDALWLAEYDSEKNEEKMVKYRRREYFEICGWRELNEDFGRGGVACLGDLRTPFVTSRSPLKTMKAEFEDGSDGKEAS